MGSLSGVDLAIAGWFVVASLVAIFMTRRGHSPATWATIAFLAGPFAVLPAAWVRYRSQAVRPRMLEWGGRGPGELSVLVGIDGSSAAEKDGSLANARAESTLAEEATAVDELLGVRPGTMVLAGSPAGALVDHALAVDDDLIVIGTHGRGDADWLQGSVASALAQEHAIRVVILGGGGADRKPRPPSLKRWCRLVRDRGRRQTLGT